jgi:hypothetical protein
VVTLLAAVASIATADFAPERSSLELPDQDVTLNTSSPELRLRFRVGSDDGRFRISAAFQTTEPARPSLEVSATQPDSRLVRVVSSAPETRTAEQSHWYSEVNVDCQEKFPCFADFEVTASADVATYAEVTGVLMVSVELASYLSEAYLSLEPLP